MFMSLIIINVNCYYFLNLIYLQYIDILIFDSEIRASDITKKKLTKIL